MLLSMRTYASVATSYRRVASTGWVRDNMDSEYVYKRMKQDQDEKQQQSGDGDGDDGDVTTMHRPVGSTVPVT